MNGNHLSESEQYWNLRAEGYSDTVGREIDTGDSERYMELVRKNLGEKRSGLKVLDVGCGPGFFPILLGKDNDVTAVDYSPEMLEKAKANVERYGSKAVFKRMDAQNLEFADGTFDLVVSRNLMWNLDDPERAYSEWLRVLKDGGRLMVFDGNHYLYLHDEDYAANHPDYKAQHSDLKSVDVSVMERIAEDLPLSSRRRPQWDASKLLGIGVRSLNIVTEGMKTTEIEKEGEKIELPFSFFICAVK